MAMRFLKDGPVRFGEELLHEVLVSDLELKNSVIDQIIHVLVRKGCIVEVDEMGVRLCLDEALVNAIRHGNKRDPHKHVTVRLYSDGGMWAVEIEDEGDGFTSDDLPDPDDPESLYLEGGRGVLLINSYMDEVSYHRRGNVVVMKRRIRSIA